MKYANLKFIEKILKSFLVELKTSEKDTHDQISPCKSVGYVKAHVKAYDMKSSPKGPIFAIFCL